MPASSDDMETLALPTSPELVDQSLQRAGMELLAREEASLRRVMGRYIRDPNTVDDLFQEVSIKVLKRFDTVRDQRTVRGWLFQVARNTCLDHIRKVQARPNNVAIEYQDDGGISRKQPIERMLSEERIDAIRKAMDSLPESQREVLRLRTDEGLDHQAIADHLGISRQAVEVRMCRGRSALKKRLSDIFGGDL